MPGIRLRTRRVSSIHDFTGCSILLRTRQSRNNTTSVYNNFTIGLRFDVTTTFTALHPFLVFVCQQRQNVSPNGEQTFRFCLEEDFDTHSLLHVRAYHQLERVVISREYRRVFEGGLRVHAYCRLKVPPPLTRPGTSLSSSLIRVDDNISKRRRKRHKCRFSLVPSFPVSKQLRAASERPPTPPASTASHGRRRRLIHTTRVVHLGSAGWHLGVLALRQLQQMALRQRYLPCAGTLLLLQ